LREGDGGFCAGTGNEYSNKKMGIPHHLKVASAGRVNVILIPLRGFEQTLHHNSFAATRSFAFVAGQFA
jgi:hypothetical protein